jgi:hypothetical protein
MIKRYDIRPRRKRASESSRPDRENGQTVEEVVSVGE